MLEKGSYVTAIICDSNGFDVVETKEYWWEHFCKFILFLVVNGSFLGIIPFAVNAHFEEWGHDFKNSKQKEYEDAKNEFKEKETEYREKIKKLGLSDSYIAKEY